MIQKILLQIKSENTKQLHFLHELHLKFKKGTENLINSVKSRIITLLFFIWVLFSVEQTRRVFGDNYGIILLISP